MRTGSITTCVLLATGLCVGAIPATAGTQQDVEAASRVCGQNIDGKIDVSRLERTGFKVISRFNKSKRSPEQIRLKKVSKGELSGKKYSVQLQLTGKEVRPSKYKHPLVRCAFKWPNDYAPKQIFSWVGNGLKNAGYRFDKTRSRAEKKNFFFWNKQNRTIRLELFFYPQGDRSSGRPLKELYFVEVSNQT